MLLRNLSILALLIASPAIAQSTDKVIKLPLKRMTLSGEIIPEMSLQSQSEFLGETDSHKLQARLDLYLKNREDLIYTAEFYFGSQKSHANLIFDTSSDWVFVMDKTCTSCKLPNRIYEPKMSDTAVNSDTVSAYNATYGQFVVVGDDIQDTVCIFDKKQWCADKFRFLTVTDVLDSMTPMDGVIGLAPDDQYNGPSFIATLFEQKKIDKKMLGIMITTVDSGKESSIVLGGYDDTQWKDYTNKDLRWYTTTTSQAWRISVNDIKIEDTSIFQSSSRKQAQFNTFYPFISLPVQEFQAFMSDLKNRVKTTQCNDKTGICYYPGKCEKQSRNLKDFKIQFADNKVYSVPVKLYVQEQLSETQSPECRVLIVRTNETVQDYVVLGQPFLHNYYQVFDYDQNRIGLYLHQFSIVSKIEENGIDNRDAPTGLAPWATALIVISILIIVGIIIAVYLIRKRNKKLAEQLVDYSRLSENDQDKRGERTERADKNVL
eukprot:403347527